MSILTQDTNRPAAGHQLAAIGHAIAGAARTVWRHLIAARERQAQRILIASLTDSQLRDLGIDRTEVSIRRFNDPHTV